MDKRNKILAVSLVVLLLVVSLVYDSFGLSGPTCSVGSTNPAVGVWVHFSCSNFPPSSTLSLKVYNNSTNSYAAYLFPSQVSGSSGTVSFSIKTTQAMLGMDTVFIYSPSGSTSLRTSVVLFVGVSPTTTSTASSTSTVTTTSTSTTIHLNGSVKHLIVVTGENEPYSNITSSSAPYLASLANDYTLLSNYYGIGPASLKSYAMLISGTSGNITDTCNSSGTNVGCIQSANDISVLTNSSCREYAESMPSPCYQQNSSDGLYVVRHNPFVYYNDVVSNLAYCDAHVVPMNMTTGAGFLSDLENGSLLSYSFITPNTCDDGHTLCPGFTNRATQFDDFLSNLIPKIQASSEWNSTAILITYDESGITSDEHVFSVLVSPLARNNYTDSAFYTQSSGLLTAEQVLGIGYLGHNDTVANSFCSDLYLTTPCSSSFVLSFGSLYSNSLSHSILINVSVSGDGYLFFNIGQSVESLPATSTIVHVFFMIPAGSTYWFSETGTVIIQDAEVS